MAKTMAMSYFSYMNLKRACIPKVWIKKAMRCCVWSSSPQSIPRRHPSQGWSLGIAITEANVMAPHTWEGDPSTISHILTVITGEPQELPKFSKIAWWRPILTLLALFIAHRHSLGRNYVPQIGHTFLVELTFVHLAIQFRVCKTKPTSPQCVLITTIHKYIIEEN